MFQEQKAQNQPLVQKLREQRTAMATAVKSGATDQIDKIAQDEAKDNLKTIKKKEDQDRLMNDLTMAFAGLCAFGACFLLREPVAIRRKSRELHAAPVEALGAAGVVAA